MDLSLNFKEEVERAGLKVLKNPDAQFCQIYLCGQILPTRESYDPKLPWVGGLQGLGEPGTGKEGQNGAQPGRRSESDR